MEWRREDKRKKKGELVWDEMIPWLIGAGVLILIILIFIILSGKGQGYLEYLRKMIRLP